MTDGFNEKHFDSRTSDAITLALLCDCPIMVADEVLEETSVKMDNPPFKATPSDPKEEIARLEEELLACEEREEYERAAEIHQRIEQLKRNQ
jgi:bifunctional DNase/RNase